MSPRAYGNAYEYQRYGGTSRSYYPPQRYNYNYGNSYGYAPRPYYGGYDRGYGYGGPSVTFGFGGGGYRGW